MGSPWPSFLLAGRGPCCPSRAGGRRPYLVVLAVGVAAAVVRQNAARAVEHVAGVALAALHAVVVAVALEADGGAAGLAHAHAAVVVAVGGAGDGCNGRRGSGRAAPGLPAPSSRPPLAARRCGPAGEEALPAPAFLLCCWNASIGLSTAETAQ